MSLEVIDLQFSYNSHAVLSEIGFSLDRGEVMCVLGVNGAGKSTLLKCLNRIVFPVRGSVLLEGRNLFSMNRNEVAQQMGYVPQHHLSTRLSVFETVLMGRRPHIRWSLTASDYKMVEGIIRNIGIEHLAMRPVDDLSGGEIQKVVIARALAQSPAVLLLDEPTSHLDLKNQLEVMSLIRQIVKVQEISAVVAIHDLNTAVRFGDRFLLLKDHRVHAVAQKNELTPEMIQQVYGVEVKLIPIGDHIMVAPI